jgi:alpha-beta hydrolase superfamily lysophospholipase
LTEREMIVYTTIMHTHLLRARAETAPGSAHALDLSGLRAPGVIFWSPGNETRSQVSGSRFAKRESHCLAVLDLAPVHRGPPCNDIQRNGSALSRIRRGFNRWGSALTRLLRFGFRTLSTLAPSLATRVAEKLWVTPPRPPIRAASTAFLATGERFELVADGRTVVGWRWGTGPAVILMHGWGGYGAQMQAFVEPLTRAGFQALIFDAPAHGASGPSRLGSRRSTLFDFADALHTVGRQAPSIAGVIAHSGGATAAAWALRSSPEWTAPAMVFIAPMASPIKYREIFQQRLGFSDGVMRRFIASTARQFGFDWEQLEVTDMAAHVKTPPLLVVHDRDDRETSWSEGAAIAGAWPDARLHTTVGLGHYRVLRDRTVIDEVVRFLRERSGASA